MHLPFILELTGRRVREGIHQPAPANVTGQHRLLIRGGTAVFGFDFLEGADRGEVVVELLNLAALAEAGVVGDLEVGSGDIRRTGGCAVDGYSRFSLRNSASSIASSFRSHGSMFAPFSGLSMMY